MSHVQQQRVIGVVRVGRLWGCDYVRVGRLWGCDYVHAGGGLSDAAMPILFFLAD